MAENDQEMGNDGENEDTAAATDAHPPMESSQPAASARTGSGAANAAPKTSMRGVREKRYRCISKMYHVHHVVPQTVHWIVSRGI
jgi:hypothetical protein